MLVVSLLAVGMLGQSVGWTPLFDGKSLDGWVQRGGTAVYSVQDGAIVGETRPNTDNSFLCTTKDYGDFELEFEFKVDDELNSGVQFRSNSVLGFKKGRVHGYQAEIDPSDRAFTGGIYDEARRGVFLQDLSKNEKGRKAFKHGVWNKYRIVARGDHLQTWVNGVPCADMHDDMTMTGFIALQVHAVGDRKDPLHVMWRNIRIKDYGFPYRAVPKGGERMLGGVGDSTNWKRQGSDNVPIGWSYRDGVATVTPGTGSIETREKFGDCEAYVEFMVDENHLEGQANGNSGVYLQGSYEVQVLNSAGQDPADNICGGIYSVKAEDINMAYPAYEWQNYLIKFTAPKWEGDKKVSNARLTVWHNGTKVHDNVEVPHMTTAGIPEAPGERGLVLQDHGNRVKYRTVWIRRM